jgi:subtilisin family serine protease
MRHYIFALLVVTVALAVAFNYHQVEIPLQRAKQRDKVHLKRGAIDAVNAIHVSSAVLKENEALSDRPAYNPETKRPFIVRFKGPVTDLVRERFEKQTGARLLEYIPHNSFVFRGKQKSAVLAKELSEVEYVAEYLPEYKISSELLTPESIPDTTVERESLDESLSDMPKSVVHLMDNGKQHASKRKPSSSDILIAVHLLPDEERTIDETVAVLRDMNEVLDKNAIPYKFFKPASKRKLIIGLDGKHVTKVARLLAQHPDTHWLEHTSPIGKKENWDVRYVMQSGRESEEPFSKAGITGKDQIIAFADSGLDVHNCFFYDKERVPFVTSSNITGARHRKIAAYNTFMDGLDDEHGHGTHIGGTIAGNSAFPDSPITKYNGHAPDAKLAIFDIGCQDKNGCSCSKFGASCPCNIFPGGICPPSESLVMPFDLYSSYFPWAYEVGARIHSNSIGGTIGLGYTGTTHEIDRFIYEHPDFLVFWSAGNSGRNEGYMTLTGPTKQSKNAVVVGASASPYAGWLDVMSNIRDYAARGKLLKAAIDQQGFCSCNSTCNTYACAQARKMLTEEGCCEVFDDCSMPHPEQGTNPLANVVNMCCQKCALKNLKDENNQPMYNEQNLAVFSSLGPSIDGRIKPDLVAPGYFTVSAKSHASDPASKCSRENVEDTRFNVKEMAGTSMATPAAAANAALVRDYFMQGFYPKGRGSTENAFMPSAALLKAVLISSARPLKGYARYSTPFAAYTPSQRRFFEGFGLINLSNTLHLAGSSNKLFVSDARKISTHQQHVYRVVLPAGSNHAEFSATLVWTDPPASPTASLALVNDLDLTVYHDKQRYLGNAIDSSINDADRVNNVEKVFINKATPGEYIVKISGFNVPMGPQAYALVITGTGIDSAQIESSFESSRTTKADFVVESDRGTATTELEAQNVAWYDREISVKTWVFGLIVGAQGAALVVALLVLVIVGIIVLRANKSESYAQVK